eukprot:5023849-Pyramimonas_sp.AAC.1
MTRSMSQHHTGLWAVDGYVSRGGPSGSGGAFSCPMCEAPRGLGSGAGSLSAGGGHGGRWRPALGLFLAALTWAPRRTASLSPDKISA